MNILQMPEITLSYKNPIPLSERVHITDSNGLVAYLRPLFEIETFDLQMEFKAVFFNYSNSVIGFKTLAKGTITSCQPDLRILFATALKCGATSFTIARNSPSGNLKPSKQDERYANFAKRIGDLHEIKVLDFLILNNEGYNSFADLGLL